MSGTTPKIVPEINLDEFERRLRAAGAPSTGVEDPLAELTRLVNAVHTDTRRTGRPARAETQAEPVDEPETGPVPAFVSPLRPSFAQAENEPDVEFDEGADAPLIDAPIDGEMERPRRSRGWTLKIVGFAVLGLALLGGAAALTHGGVPGLAKAPPFIAADEAPTKVQPPNEATVQSSGDIAALLMKDSATPTPVKVVTNEEQPVDLRTQTQPTPGAPAADASPTPPANGGSPVAVSGSPVVANAPDTPVVPPAAPSASVAPMFPAAKPVKTVSVRPDGTLIAADATPVAPPPNPAPTPPEKSAARAIDTVVASPEAATPKLDLPTKLSPPKSAARVVAKTDTTAPADATDTTPSAPLPLVGPPSKPARTAAAKTVVAAAPTDAAPADVAPDEAPAAAPPAAEGDGQWAVQLAAPRSEADAKRAIARLKSKYAEALGDSELGVRQADVKGQAIYRVRVGGLSKADAGALCAKLKAGGGDCFIARE